MDLRETIEAMRGAHPELAAVLAGLLDRIEKLEGQDGAADGERKGRRSHG